MVANLRRRPVFLTGTRYAGKKATVGSSRVGKPLARGGRKYGRLSRLIDMPLDVLFEIFGLLEPADLISLSRSSKMLRETLMSRKSITVWKAAARNEVLDAPYCPKDISEPVWANLLFGGTQCQVCGTSNVQGVDFLLRRRVCKFCLRNNLIEDSKFSKTFPDHDPLIMDLIPYTDGGWRHKYESDSKYFWKDDIRVIAEQLREYQEALDLCQPGAKQAMEDFKRDRMVLVKGIIEYAQECQLWFDHMPKWRLGLQKAARLKAIKDKFLELGYIRSDLDKLNRQPEVDQATPLTDRIWKRIRPLLEPDVQHRKSARLFAERQLLVGPRQTAFTHYYNEKVKKFSGKSTDEGIYFPRAADIFEIREIDQLLSRADNSVFNPEEEAWVKVFEKLDVLIQEWTSQRKRELVAMLCPVSSSSNITNTSSERVNISLRLATSVFRCATRACLTAFSQHSQHDVRSVLIGWDGVAAHGCKVHIGLLNRDLPIKTVVEFSERGSAAVHSLLSLFRLDPLTAVPADLDGLDVVLTCSHCAISLRDDDVFPVMSWRGAVYHIMSMETHPTPQWEVLSGAIRYDVLMTHCEDSDLSLDPQAVHVSDLLYAFHPTHCHCLECPTKTRKFRVSQGVREHLNVKHGIRDALPGIHFVQTRECCHGHPMP